MYENFYSIAGLSIKITSDFSPSDDAYSAMFRVPDAAGKADIECFIKTADSPRKSRGRLLMKNDDVRLFRDGDTVSLDLVFHGGDRILAQSEYDISGGAINVEVMSSEMPYIARTAHIWAVADICYALLTRGRLVMHSSSVMTGGKAILFAAPSGTGKSTQAAIWEKYRGADIMNGDKNCVSYDDKNGAAFSHGLPFCGTSGICRQYSLPLGAIVLLKQSRENSVRQLKGVAALSALSQNCMGHKAVPETMIMMSDVISKIMKEVPVFELSCTPDERAADALEKVLRW